jgi:hypothetical protein
LLRNGVVGGTLGSQQNRSALTCQQLRCTAGSRQRFQRMFL